MCMSACMCARGYACVHVSLICACACERICVRACQHVCRIVIGARVDVCGVWARLHALMHVISRMHICNLCMCVCMQCPVVWRDAVNVCTRCMQQLYVYIYIYISNSYVHVCVYVCVVWYVRRACASCNARHVFMYVRVACVHVCARGCAQAINPPAASRITSWSAGLAGKKKCACMRCMPACMYA